MQTNTAALIFRITPIRHSCSGSSAAFISLMPGLTVVTSCPPLRSRCTAKLMLHSLPLLSLSAVLPGFRT